MRYLSIAVIGCIFILCRQVLDAQQPIPQDTTFNVCRVYRQIKKEFPFAVPSKDIVPKNVKAVRNIIYATLPNTPFGKRYLHLDVFYPKKSGKYPALIMVHGGGWRSGTRSLQVPMAEMIAKKGFVTVSVEYQLSLEAKYPAAVYNIKAAIRWMRAHAKEYHIDPTRIAISGCSSGGQLAMLVGMTNGERKFEGNMGNPQYSSSVQAIIDVDGVVDFLAPGSLNLKREPDSPDVFWLGGSFDQKPEIWKDASSVFWTNKNSVPVLFLNSGFPRFHAGQDELIGMMQRWRIYTEVHRFNVHMHPFWLFYPWVDPTVNYMAKFLDKILKR
ncbi:alpha/beta hydrolase [Microbacter margulisiae]|uniref:Pectinesterase n=1 Tax=Microbacter margulisiae TaxID=1350067 RepID=A0A7W5DSV8_9PORP|nr:alpha/beta hydrolase [Microbacter margulisiae]MBB3187974.1 pectinesterase [Microbacter margulisiae]